MTSEEIEEIKEKMCDEYCSMPRFFGREKLEEVCENCPMNRLEADDE